ncbi:MAG: peptidoglycan-binding protein [Hyphomicrobiales bacterium]
MELPKDFNKALIGRSHWKTVAEWKKLGVVRADGKALGSKGADAFVMVPQGVDGPRFLVTRGTPPSWITTSRIPMRWRWAIWATASVGRVRSRVLADVDYDLSFEQRVELQNRLNALGFNTGGNDGRFGARTYEAIIAFEAPAFRSMADPSVHARSRAQGRMIVVLRRVVLILVLLAGGLVSALAQDNAPVMGSTRTAASRTAGTGADPGDRRCARQELGAGLARMADPKAYVVTNRFGNEESRPGAPRVYDWSDRLPKILESNDFDAAVVMLGSNDRQQMRDGNERYAFNGTGMRSPLRRARGRDCSTCSTTRAWRSTGWPAGRWPMPTTTRQSSPSSICSGPGRRPRARPSSTCGRTSSPRTAATRTPERTTRAPW